MYKVYTIFDKIAGEGTTLFLAKNDKQAEREFARYNIERKAYNPFHKTEDYTVLCLGIYYNDIQDNVRLEVKEEMPYDLGNIKPLFDPTIYDTPEFQEYKESKERKSEILKQANEEISRAMSIKEEKEKQLKKGEQ